MWKLAVTGFVVWGVNTAVAAELPWLVLHPNSGTVEFSFIYANPTPTFPKAVPLPPGVNIIDPENSISKVSCGYVKNLYVLRGFKLLVFVDEPV